MVAVFPCMGSEELRQFGGLQATKAEAEMQDKRRWEQEERAEEAKAEERARSSSPAESQGMQGAMPPVYAATSQATGEQGAMPPVSSSGAEQFPHEVPKRRPRVPAPARPDYDPPTDDELRRWAEQDRKRKEYEKQREAQAQRIRQVLEAMERQNLVETEPQPTHRWQDARRAVEPTLYLQDEAWPLDPSKGFWVNYTKRVVQYLILLAGEVKSGVLAAARKAQPRGLVALYQQWLEYHEWTQFVFVIPPEVLSVGVILDLLPNTSECNEAKHKWDSTHHARGKNPSDTGPRLQLHQNAETKDFRDFRCTCWHV